MIYYDMLSLQGAKRSQKLNRNTNQIHIFTFKQQFF